MVDTQVGVTPYSLQSSDTQIKSSCWCYNLLFVLLKFDKGNSTTVFDSMRSQMSSSSHHERCVVWRVATHIGDAQVKVSYAVLPTASMCVKHLVLLILLL